MKYFEIFGVAIIFFAWCETTQALLPPTWEAKRGEAPYFAYVSDRSYFCGGAVIHASIVLIAAHCLVENMPNHKVISVVAGTITPNRRDYRKQTRMVESVIVHDKYQLGENNVQAYYDIALIKLVEPFKLNAFLQPIKVGTLDPKEDVLLYGYGSTDSFRNRPSETLLGKSVTLIPDDVCQSMLDLTKTKSIKQDYEMCLTIGYCHGDSGSPMIQIQKQIPRVVGVASWVADDIYGCNTPPAVAVNVNYFRDWLQESLVTLLPTARKASK